MRKLFDISGLFYKIGEFKFRKYLNIKLKNSFKQRPDLMVIMMNPGASKPIDEIDNNDSESEAIPDRTQNQIMKVMIACKLEFARVLNLTDIREPKSNRMFLKAKEIDQKGIPHSIFDPRRKKEFTSLFIKGIPVIFAWGVGKELKDLAEMAIEAIGNDNRIGLNKKDFDWAYYHPLPQAYKKQIEWVDKITKSLLFNSKNEDPL
ncbi:hypothetical protein [Lutimonas vermicola]|uniref:DUF1643 domain-containing protein n=1 Tax=Lutimonas vermicola TaxID=414288 RepID=A0ABU9L2R8_9FLAO